MGWEAWTSVRSSEVKEHQAELSGRCVSLMLRRQGKAAGVHFRSHYLVHSNKYIDLPQGERGVRRRLWTKTQKNEALGLEPKMELRVSSSRGSG